MIQGERCGVVICPVWRDLGIEGEFLIIVHYVRRGPEPQITAAFTRYNGELTDITDKFQRLKLNPDWRTRLTAFSQRNKGDGCQ